MTAVTDTTVSLWTICDSPSDYPGKFVVRQHFVGAASQFAAVLPAAVVDSLEAAREHIPYGLVHCPRHKNDDPVIVETWV